MRDKIIIGLFLMAVFINFLGPITDVDFPFHLKAGEYLYQHKEIPKDDPFSYNGEGVTTDRERFMLSQYWLAQVIFYKLFSIFGPPGIIFLRAIILFSFILLIWLSLKRRGLYTSIIIAILINIILWSYKLERPQLFSILFAIILILIFEKFRENPDSLKLPYFIPILMLLWSNMHGGFVFGLAIILIYTLSETLKFFVKKIKPALPIGQPLPEKSVIMLLLAGLTAIIFSYINPDTNGQLVATIESYTTTKWLYSGVREYMSPLEETRFPLASKFTNISFWILFGFVTILFSLAIIRKRAVDITVLSLSFFSSFAALTSMRYIPFFIAIVLPLSKDWRFFKDSSFLKRLARSWFTFIIFLLFFVTAIGFGIKYYKNSFRFGSHKFYAAGAADFLLKNQIDAHIYNTINKGSYLLWRLYPHYRVFQDTRYISLDAMLDGHSISYALEDNTQTLNSALGNALSALVPEELGKIEVSEKGYLNNPRDKNPLWKKQLQKYNIDLFVHEATFDYNGALYPLTLRLLNDDEWVLIYLDGVIQIFIKNDEKYSEVIKKYKKPKELVYDEIILETAPLVKNKVTFATAYSSLAFALMMKGKEDDAKKMIDAALELDKADLVANFCNAYFALRENNNKN